MVDFSVAIIVFTSIFAIFNVYFNQMQDEELRKKESILFKVFYLVRISVLVLNIFFTVSLVFVTYFFSQYEDIYLQENVKEELKHKINGLPYDIEDYYIFVWITTLITLCFELNQIYWNKLIDKSYCNLNAFNINKKIKEMEKEY